MHKDNSGREIPYVDSALVTYLRDVFCLKNSLIASPGNPNLAYGELLGINLVISRLEYICKEQEAES